MKLTYKKDHNLVQLMNELIEQNAINTATDLMRQYASQNLSLSVNDIQTTYSQSRLGLIDNGRGTQN